MIEATDTADTEALAEAVLARRHLVEIRVFAGPSDADEHTSDHLGDCLYNDQGTLWAALSRRLTVSSAEII
jgi:hypothetical protein